MKRIIVPMFLLLLAAAGCDDGQSGNDGGIDGGDYPDPAFVYEASGQVQTAADEAFWQETPLLYRTLDALPDLDVRSLAVYDHEVWAGTASGLVAWDPMGDTFAPNALPGGDEAVLDLADRKLDDGRLALALAGRLVLFDPDGAAHRSVDSPPARAVATDGVQVWLGTDQGLWKLDGDSLVQVAEAPQVEIRDLAVDGAAVSTVWIATPGGLVAFDGATSTFHTAGAGALPDDDVRAVAALPGGGVLAGCATGAALVGTAADRVIPVGKGALPYDDVTAVAVGDSAIFLGHAIGATFVSGDFDHKDYYHSLRWIPAEQVTAVALQALQGEHRRWIATNGGISRIELVENTLADKAALFENVNQDFWRLDFVSCDGSRDEPWDTARPIRHHDHDNDGLWTQIQIVAWSYAAAATGDRSFCELARRAMGGMMWQIDIPAVDFEAAGMSRGFVTRSFVRDDEGEVFTSKAAQPNWHLVQGWEDGHDYYWKDDTSSDETTGHFFGFPVFYDLCAEDEAERQALADHAGALARYIVDNDFLLIDLDGVETTHGHWNPERLAIALDGLDVCMQDHDIDVCVEARYGGGWLNAIEILGHMLAAWHMTGDPVFYDAYETLITDHRYAELIDFSENVFTVTKRNTANHSDHELAMLAFHTLIRYEPNDERRQRWIQSLLDMYEYEIPERNPLWSAIIAGFVEDGYYLDEALQTLREWPEDWREWLVDNTHRKDVTRDIPDRFGDAQFTEVLPYDEIRTMKWNGNPYDAISGGDGRSVQAPWPWLLPYWIYRYHGVIQ